MKGVYCETDTCDGCGYQQEDADAHYSIAMQGPLNGGGGPEVNVISWLGPVRGQVEDGAQQHDQLRR